MKRSEREAVLSLLEGRLPDGWSVRVVGAALRFEQQGKPAAIDNWFIDCPSWAGSTGRRQIGRFVPINGGPYAMWTAKTRRFLGRGWEKEIADGMVWLLLPTPDLWGAS